MRAPSADDPVAGFLCPGLVYRTHARRGSQLYRLMFGIIDAGRIRSGEPALIAAQAWSVIHGYALLEIAGALGDHGLGESPEAAARSALLVQRSS